MTARWEAFAERWPTKGARERLAELQAGAEVLTSSAEVFSALFSVGDPAAMRYAVTGEQGDRRYLFGADDVLREVS
ncbi:hypothetical protein AB0H42_04285 [Nocardia sp. NPDC050799]|uniref:hypothetical protein n=1 Tax=Nocardia sp. NPDC050799 TaxID=3154842 RepID=UPI003410D6C0